MTGPPMSEKAFQARVVELCSWLHLLNFHPYDARRSAIGYPDLTIVGPGGVIWVELKTQTGRLSAAQQHWIARLEAAGQEVFVWRPADWDRLEARLKRLATEKRGATHPRGTI